MPNSACKHLRRRERGIFLKAYPFSPSVPSDGSLSSSVFFNDTATTEIYTLSLHDALPISHQADDGGISQRHRHLLSAGRSHRPRSEEHTSELQSRLHLVCRLLLEKKN